MSAAAEAGFAGDAPAGALLSAGERRSLGVQLVLALLAGGLLLLSVALRALAPDQEDVAQLVAGGAALLVAVPAAAAAWHSLRQPDLHGVTDQLVAQALLAAWAAGDLVTAALLPLVMTVGHMLEERSLLGSQEAIRALGRYTRGTARRLRPDGTLEDVATDTLRPADRIELRPGDRVPADGIIRTGRASIDAAAVTGESVPALATPGDAVHAGSLNLDGVLTVEVTRLGTETTLGQVVRLMQSAERAKPPVTRLLERYAGRYTGLVLLVAAATWLGSGDTAAMLAVLVASCPCALVLAAPATSVAAIAVSARHGILVKGVAFLESLASTDAVVLDKTGTVTMGQLRLVAARPVPGVAEAELLRIGGVLGAASNHPVSRALAAQAQAGAALRLDEVREHHGLGLTALAGTGMAAERLALGRPELFAELGVPCPPAPAHDGPIAGIARDGAFLGWVLLADALRPEAPEALAALGALGLRRQVLLTGDRWTVARTVGAALGVTEVEAEALPDRKLARVLAETRAGYRPMVVGDGINDALALKAGAVGVAMGRNGTDVALASADLVLLGDDLRRLGTAVRLSRRCRRTVHANVALGLGWTAALIACAAAGLLGTEGALLAAVLHNLGTLAVVANAGRLLKFQDGAPPAQPA